MNSAVHNFVRTYEYMLLFGNNGEVVVYSTPSFLHMHSRHATIAVRSKHKMAAVFYVLFTAVQRTVHFCIMSNTDPLTTAAVSAIRPRMFSAEVGGAYCGRTVKRSRSSRLRCGIHVLRKELSLPR